jgi:hypothetical protein
MSETNAAPYDGHPYCAACGQYHAITSVVCPRQFVQTSTFHAPSREPEPSERRPTEIALAEVRRLDGLALTGERDMNETIIRGGTVTGASIVGRDRSAHFIGTRFEGCNFDVPADAEGPRFSGCVFERCSGQIQHSVMRPESETP